MILVPLFDTILYPMWERYQDDVNSLHKIAAGMFFICVSFLMTGILQLWIQLHPGKVSIFWQLPQYVFISMAEVLFAIPLYEFFYSQAPMSMKSFISSLSTLMNAAGMSVAGLVYFFSKSLDRASTYFLFACMMGANLIVFSFVAKRYEFKHHGAIHLNKNFV